jgi:membrane-anchored mycosin MYCP
MASVGLAAMILAAGPGGWPAIADTPTSSTAQPGPSFWEPPPVNNGARPADGNPGPPPGTTFTQSAQCVQSATNGVTLRDEPAAQSMLDIRAAQQFSTGAGVKVAVIDTGVNPHPFLTDHGRLVGGGDYITPSTSNGTSDCDGHGTLTAGIVAADTRGTDLGFTGVAPDATIVAIRQTSSLFKQQVNGQDGGQTAGTPGTLASAIVHAVNLGVGVITTSVDTCLLRDHAVAEMDTPDSEEQQLQAAVAYALDHNVVVVNSAGNSASQPEGNSDGQQQASTNECSTVAQNDDPNPNNVKEIEIPAVFTDDLLSVASVSPSTGAVSSFSVWGPWVNIAAPGEDITSVDPGVGGKGLSNLFAEPGGSSSQPGPIQGTSFAAPYVAGVVALVRAKYPNLTARQVIQRVEATAQHPSGPDGRNNQVGFGIVNPVAALTAMIPGQNGVPANNNQQVRAVLPMPAVKNWTPMRVALIGTVASIALLLSTLFVVRTVRRRART